MKVTTNNNHANNNEYDFSKFNKEKIQLVKLTNVMSWILTGYPALSKYLSGIICLFNKKCVVPS